MSDPTTPPLSRSSAKLKAELDALSAQLPQVTLIRYDAMDVMWTLVPVLFVAQDTGRIVAANRACEELFGYNLGELYGVEVDELVPKAVREKHRTHRAKFAEEPYQTARPMGQGLPIHGRHRVGHVFPVTISLHQFVHSGHRLVMAVITDMRLRHAAPPPADPEAVDLV